MTNPDFISYEINPSVKSSIEEPTKPIQITINMVTRTRKNEVYHLTISVVRPVRFMGEPKNLKTIFEISITTKEGLLFDYISDGSIEVLRDILGEILATSDEYSGKIYGSSSVPVSLNACEQAAVYFLRMNRSQFAIPFR